MNIDEKTVEAITKMVIQSIMRKKVLAPIGVSNRHVHIDRFDADVLFGKGYELTKMKDLKQYGQYAAEETVTIKGAKGQIEKVRILGPLRKETQVEISLTDGFKLGVNAPVKESGELNGTPGIEIIGPNGSVKKDKGVIAALRHIHMPPETAQLMGLCDKQIVSVEIGSSLRRSVLNNVLIRVSDQFSLEMHIDTDEANATGSSNNDFATILID